MRGIIFAVLTLLVGALIGIGLENWLLSCPSSWMRPSRAYTVWAFIRFPCT